MGTDRRSETHCSKPRFKLLGSEPPPEATDKEDHFRHHSNIADILAELLTQEDKIGAGEGKSGFAASKNLKVGLFGRWGAGKTFIWRMLQRRLVTNQFNSDDAQYIPVEVDLWRATADSLRYSILNETYKKLDEGRNRPWHFFSDWWWRGHIVRRQKKFLSEASVPGGDYAVQKPSPEATRSFGLVPIWLVGACLWIVLLCALLLVMFQFYDDSGENLSFLANLVKNSPGAILTAATIIGAACIFVLPRKPIFHEENYYFRQLMRSLLITAWLAKAPKKLTIVFALENFDRNSEFPEQFFDVINMIQGAATDAQGDLVKTYKNPQIRAHVLVTVDRDHLRRLMERAYPSIEGQDFPEYVEKFFDLTLDIPPVGPHSFNSEGDAKAPAGSLEFTHSQVKRLFEIRGENDSDQRTAEELRSQGLSGYRLRDVDALILTYVISLWAGDRPRGPQRFLDELSVHLRRIEMMRGRVVDETDRPYWPFLFVAFAAINLVTMRNSGRRINLRHAELYAWSEREDPHEPTSRLQQFLVRTSFIWHFCPPDVWADLTYGRPPNDEKSLKGETRLWPTVDFEEPKGWPWWDSQEVICNKRQKIFEYFADHTDKETMLNRLREDINNGVGGVLGPISRLLLLDTVAVREQKEFVLLWHAFGFSRATERGVRADGIREPEIARKMEEKSWRKLHSILSYTQSDKPEDRQELLADWVLHKCPNQNECFRTSVLWRPM